MRLLLLLAILSSAVPAQIVGLAIPESMSVPTAQVASARDLGRWQLAGCNGGTSVVKVFPERLIMAVSTVPFVDDHDSAIVLASRARRSVAGRAVMLLTVGGQVASVVLAIASKSNYAWTTGFAVGSALMPPILAIARSQVPDPGQLLSPDGAYPLLLEPGGCFTVHMFAGKMRSPKIVRFEIADEDLVHVQPVILVPSAMPIRPAARGAGSSGSNELARYDTAPPTSVVGMSSDR